MFLSSFPFTFILEEAVWVVINTKSCKSTNTITVMVAFISDRYFLRLHLTGLSKTESLAAEKTPKGPELENVPKCYFWSGDHQGVRDPGIGPKLARRIRISSNFGMEWWKSILQPIRLRILLKMTQGKQNLWKCSQIDRIIHVLNKMEGFSRFLSKNHPSFKSVERKILLVNRTERGLWWPQLEIGILMGLSPGPSPLSKINTCFPLNME